MPFTKLPKLIDYRLLEARSRLQELALAAVFTEFPRQIKDWRYETEDLEARLKDALAERLKRLEARFDAVKNRLSPIRLAANVGEQKTRLAVLRQRQSAAVRALVDARGERLKIEMASLDALSPLAVLRRGYSIATGENGEIISSVTQIKQNARVQIRLSDGKLKAEVLESEKD